MTELLSDSRRLSALRRAVGKWYDGAARDLPWRRTRDPYAIWISEIMLQQTTVAAVIPYFERFLARFPTVSALAKAQESEVLRHWEGLGYYSRARNIHRAARTIVEEYGGEFPRDVQALNGLPGVGRYTAGAIASFAFDLPAPIVEANTLRLYCRLLGFAGDPRSSAGQKVLWNFAERLVSRTAPGRLNQALTELGATVCTPTEPACERCPAKSSCAAFRGGLQAEIPRPAERPPITDVTEAAIAIRQRRKYLLRQRQPGERWAGLWDFPRAAWDGLSVANEIPASRPLPPPIGLRVCEFAAELTGMEVTEPQLLTEIRHSVTRFRIRLLCFTADFVAGRRPPNAGKQNGAPFQWVRPEQFSAYPLSVTGRKFAELLLRRESAG